ncbi:BRO family protein [Rhodococcus rhodochrous]|uniref:BRO family protein n=1 Tax=Rhodococcus rhodochrous TaxID=1829 RepID=UPI00178349E4|nr:BRO family protein [Rhodococcus rhodochrous]
MNSAGPEHREETSMSASDSTGQLVPFTYGTTNVRTIDLNGEPWFVAADVASVLEYSATSAMNRRLDPEDKGVRDLHTPGGIQQMTIISEPGFYAAILGSQSAKARDIKRWLTHDVLPTIRRTGTYSVAPALTGAELLAHAVLEAQQMLTEKDEKIAELEPKANFYDELMNSDGTFDFAATARILGWGRNVMMRELRKLGVLQSNNLPYRRYDHHFKVTPGTYINRNTREVVPTATTTVRPPGIEFLRKKLAQITEPVQLELEGSAS